MQRWFQVVAVAIVLSVLSARSAEAADVFHFTSSPTSWIGQGQTLTFEPPTNPLSTHRFYDQGAYTNAVEISAGGYGLRIVEPDYTLPEVGFFNATRWPFMGSGAGMDFTGPGRGNNTLTGWFNVLQADYNPDGSVHAFAVDFRQNDEGNPLRWNQGAIRYNSSIPIPEPASAALLLMGLPLLACRRRR